MRAVVIVLEPGAAIMKLVKHLLANKPSGVLSIHPDGSVLDAIKMMAERSIGALLVIDEQGLVGIVSERDYARKVILKGRSSRETLVRDIMTANVVTTTPEDSVNHCMTLMTRKRFRHLPVIENDLVVGVVSIGDLVGAIIADQQEEIEQLGQYISG